LASQFVLGFLSFFYNKNKVAEFEKKNNFNKLNLISIGYDFGTYQVAPQQSLTLSSHNFTKIKFFF
jgi:hypothetical protein